MKIKHLKLDCANLEEQRHFYTKKFGFEIAAESEEQISLQAGDSLLTFEENRLKKSYYHFAFNIPYHAVEKAVSWVRKKVEVITTEEGEIQEFPDWEARAIYFLDPAGNIVELIGRKRLDQSKPKAFSESQILSISEIGLPVADVNQTYHTIEEVCGIEKFDCPGSRFCACGDDEGLFIVVDKAEKTWFPTDEMAREYPVRVDFERDNKRYQLSLERGDLTVVAKK